MGIESPRGRNKLAAPARPALSPERSESLIDADLSNYFGTIPHRELMKMVARRVSDGSVLRLIKSWLRAPVVEEDKDGTKRVVPNRCGTPQGGVMTPRTQWITRGFSAPAPSPDGNGMVDRDQVPAHSNLFHDRAQHF